MRMFITCLQEHAEKRRAKNQQRWRGALGNIRANLKLTKSRDAKFTKFE